MKNIKKEINNKLDIVDIIGSYIELEKSGSNHKAICPFHEDNNPSLYVNSEKEIFKCFVCDIGGTAFDFVQKFEKLSFDETVQKLSKQFNIPLKNVYEKEKIPEYEVQKDINLFYMTMLEKSEKSQEAKKYLDLRKITTETQKKFGIGYSPPFEKSLEQFLRSRMETNNEYSQIDIDNVGVLNDKGFDFFGGRLTIPIYDEKSSLVGFSGRTLNDNKIKYLNSKEHKYFQKKKILYNLQNVLKVKTNDIIIVEGYFDVINAFQYGIINVVATMGVAISKEHIVLLKKKGFKNIILGFDNDKVGKKANLMIGESLLKNGFHVNILQYKNGKDLDEHLKNSNNNNINNIKMDYLLYLSNQYKETTLNETRKSKLINHINQLLKEYANDAEKKMLISNISSILEIDESFFIYGSKTKKVELQNKLISLALPSDLEKIIFYLCVKNFDDFQSMEKKVKNKEYVFKKYDREYEILKRMYKEKEKLNIIDVFNEIEAFNEIDNYVKKYEIFKKFQKNITLNELLEYGESKNKKMTKLWK